MTTLDAGLTLEDMERGVKVRVGPSQMYARQAYVSIKDRDECAVDDVWLTQSECITVAKALLASSGAEAVVVEGKLPEVTDDGTGRLLVNGKPYALFTTLDAPARRKLAVTNVALADLLDAKAARDAARADLTHRRDLETRHVTNDQKATYWTAPQSTRDVVDRILELRDEVAAK